MMNLNHNHLSFNFTSEKAGMQGLDREEIDKIIYEATKDSVITKKKMEDLEKIKLIVEDHKVALNNLHKNDILFQQNAKLADLRIKNLKADRILNRIWLHIDMDMFYAAVEIRDNPSLKDKPIAVGSEQMVATSNYVARKFGVRSAMPGFIAKRLCRCLIFVPPNFRKYEEESHKIMEILAKYDSDIEVRGLDEAYLDLTHYCQENYAQTEDEIKDIVREIKKKILESTQLTASCGIACNKMLAKIGSDLEKPDGLSLIKFDLDYIENFMKSLKIRKIPFVGEKLETRLNLLGIYTCEDLLSKYVDIFFLFSENQFDFLVSSCLGIGNCYHDEVRDMNKSISCSDTFKMTNDIGQINKIFLTLCKKLSYNMVEQSVSAKTLTIEVTDKKERRNCKSVSLLQRFANESDLIKNGWKLITSVLESAGSIRMLRVKVSSLIQVNPEILKRSEEGSINHWIEKLKNNKDSHMRQTQSNQKEIIRTPSAAKQEKKTKSSSRKAKTRSNSSSTFKPSSTIDKLFEHMKLKQSLVLKDACRNEKKNVIKRQLSNSSSGKKNPKAKKSVPNKSSSIVGPIDNFLIKKDLQ